MKILKIIILFKEFSQNILNGFVNRRKIVSLLIKQSFAKLKKYDERHRGKRLKINMKK